MVQLTYRVEFEADLKTKQVTAKLPTLNHTADFGDTAEEALTNFRELATGLIEVLLDEGKDIPPSDRTDTGGVYHTSWETAENRIRRKNQVLMDVRSGYINLGSVTGISIRRLSKTEAFGYYDFHGSPWIPMVDWKDIAQESFPGCQLFSLKEMTERTERYSDWRSFETAITNAESKMHFFRDGPIYATAVSSFKAGVERVYRANQDRIREGRERGSLIRWTSTDSGSVRR